MEYNSKNIIIKASKRICSIRVLKRSGVPPQDLIHIYLTLIRPVLEYCCAVWYFRAYLKRSRRSKKVLCASCFQIFTIQTHLVLPNVIVLMKADLSFVRKCYQILSTPIHVSTIFCLPHDRRVRQ